MGWGFFALTSVLLLAALASTWTCAGTRRSSIWASTAFLALIGVLLTTRRPEHRISWVLALIALWGTIGGLAYAYAVEALVGHPGSLPGGLAAAWVDNWWWLPGLALPLSALLLLMPDGHLASPRWWPVPVVMLLGTVLGTLAVSTSPTFDLGTATPIENPLARTGGSAVAVAGIVGAALVVPASRVTRGLRRPLPQLGRGRAAAVALGRPVARPRCTTVRHRRAAVGHRPGRRGVDGLAFLALPTGIAVAILKYRLYEIDLVVNRALVYGVLTVCVVGPMSPSSAWSARRSRTAATSSSPSS